MSASGVCSTIMERITKLEVPTPPSSAEKTVYLILGVLNCFIFGIGMIILGVIRNDIADLLIGVLQLVLFCVGWIWAIIWGVLIAVRAAS